jgi:hypothetical protein
MNKSPPKMPHSVARRGDRHHAMRVQVGMFARAMMSTHLSPLRGWIFLQLFPWAEQDYAVACTLAEKRDANIRLTIDAWMDVNPFDLLFVM